MIECPNCAAPVDPDAPGHSDGACVIGCLLAVLEVRDFEFAGTSLLAVDSDKLWAGFIGPAVDEIEGRLEATRDRPLDPAR